MVLNNQLPERVCTDAVKSKSITDKGKLLLYCALCQRKDALSASDAVAQTIVINILIDYKGNSERALFPCFLFCNL